MEPRKGPSDSGPFCIAKNKFLLASLYDQVLHHRRIDAANAGYMAKEWQMEGPPPEGAIQIDPNQE